MTRNAPIMRGLSVLSLALVAACSTTEAGDVKAAEGPDPRRGEKVDRICFNRSIDSFSNASKNSVVLQTSPNRQYLVETGSCFQLDRAQRIALDSTTSCLTRGDRLIVSENFFSGSDRAGIDVDRCYVKAMYIWNKNAELAETLD